MAQNHFGRKHEEGPGRARRPIPPTCGVPTYHSPYGSLWRGIARRLEATRDRRKQRRGASKEPVDKWNKGVSPNLLCGLRAGANPPPPPPTLKAGGAGYGTARRRSGTGPMVWGTPLLLETLAFLETVVPGLRGVVPPTPSPSRG